MEDPARMISQPLDDLGVFVGGVVVGDGMDDLSCRDSPLDGVEERGGWGNSDRPISGNSA